MNEEKRRYLPSLNKELFNGSNRYDRFSFLPTDIMWVMSWTEIGKNGLNLEKEKMDKVCLSLGQENGG